MKPVLNRQHLLFIFLAVLAVMAATSLMGMPLIPHEVLASLGGLGMAPMMVGETAPPSLIQLKDLIEDQGKAWEAHRATNNALIAAKADGRSRATPWGNPEWAPTAA